MEIEKGIPLSDPRALANKGRSKYPWAQMEVGDSFHARVSSNSLRTTAAHFARKTGWKFVVRKDGEGARAWRIA